MEFLTNEKLTIVGAAGMIGSNMAQTALMMRLTPHLCLYDPYAPALEGVAEELRHCAFKGVDITFTSDVKEALTGASYIVSSGGAARKAGMTREDLLKGNAEIAAQFGKDIRSYCPDVKHVVVVFNPADITGLIVLLYSGLKPSQVSTLAALDSTRLQSELAKYFHAVADEIENCRTYGGHGEQMAHRYRPCPVSDVSHGDEPCQSPAYLSIEMIAAAMGGNPFTWPAGVYLSDGKFNHILMAMETILDRSGVHYNPVYGTPEEDKELERSYKHLCDLRDEVIAMGIIPPVSEWNKLNKNIE